MYFLKGLNSTHFHFCSHKLRCQPWSIMTLHGGSSKWPWELKAGLVKASLWLAYRSAADWPCSLSLSTLILKCSKTAYCRRKCYRKWGLLLNICLSCVRMTPTLNSLSEFLPRQYSIEVRGLKWERFAITWIYIHY